MDLHSNLCFHAKDNDATLNLSWEAEGRDIILYCMIPLDRIPLIRITENNGQGWSMTYAVQCYSPYSLQMTKYGLRTVIQGDHSRIVTTGNERYFVALQDLFDEFIDQGSFYLLTNFNTAS